MPVNMNRKLDLQQPNKFEDWRENDEPTSDLYRLTGVSQATSFENRKSIEVRRIFAGVGRSRRTMKPNGGDAGL